MTDLPRGWSEVILGDIVTTRSGNSKLIKGKLSSEPGVGLIPAFSASGQDVWCSEAEYEGDGIVLSAVGARCGKAFLTAGAWTAIANTHVIIPAGGIDARFLWYRLNDERFWIRSGSAQPFVKVKASLKAQLSLPPVNEQRRIVAAIEKHLSRLDAADAFLAAAVRRNRQLRRATLAHAFSGPWDEEPLRDIAADTLIGLDRSRAAQSADPGGSPYLRMGNIDAAGRMTWDDMTFVQVTDAERVRFDLRTGDLVFNTRNSRELVGKVGLVRDPPDHAVFNNNLMRIRLREHVDPSYAWAAMNGPVFRSLLDSVKSATTNVAAIYAKNLLPLRLPIPPLNEQRRIVARLEEQLSAIDALGVSIDRSQRRLTSLRRATLERAFSGELVPQDPSDEPASVLLERIRAERAAAPPPSRRRREPT